MRFQMIVYDLLKLMFTSPGLLLNRIYKLIVFQRYNIMSRRHSPTANTKQLDNTNYKHLYQECKHNIALFMQQVELQITAIIQQHHQQKKQLHHQITLLQQQFHNQPPTNSAKHSPTITHQHTEQQHSTIPSTFIRSNRNSTDRLFNKQPQYIEQLRNRAKNVAHSVRNSSTRRYIEKENVQLRLHSKDCQNKTANTIQLHQQNSILALRRAKKLQSIADSRPVQKVQSITDILKNIRNTQHHKQEQTRIVTVLTPQMFSSANTSRVMDRRKT